MTQSSLFNFLLFANSAMMVLGIAIFLTAKRALREAADMRHRCAVMARMLAGVRDVVNKQRVTSMDHANRLYRLEGRPDRASIFHLKQAD